MAGIFRLGDAMWERIEPLILPPAKAQRYRWIDGKSLLGGGSTGKNPTDRAKLGVKRSVLDPGAARRSQAPRQATGRGAHPLVDRPLPRDARPLTTKRC